MNRSILVIPAAALLACALFLPAVGAPASEEPRGSGHERRSTTRLDPSAQVALAPPARVAMPVTPTPETRPVAGPSVAPEPASTEEALGRDLRLTPEQTERVGEVIRAADARLRADMAALCERGYDDLLAQRLGERFEEQLLADVEQVLPADRRAAFRDLMEQERLALASR